MNYSGLTHYNNNNSSSKKTLVPAYDWNEFVCDLQEMYNEFKKMSGEMTQRTRHVLGEKFSGTFQNKYAQLSVKFDSLIQRAETSFESHRGALQDSQQHVSQLLGLLPVQQCYGYLLTIVSQLLLSSQSLYREYIKQQVFTIKQELQTIVIKNYQLQQQITKVYQSYEQVKQRLDEEMNYRFQLQKHLVGLQKEIQFIKQENYQLNKANKSLIKSKHDLDQEVQVTKQQHKILKKSQLQKYDKLKQEQTKTLQLEKQIDTLHHQIFTLQHQLQDSKNQQQNFIEEIKHLTEIIDNQSYELQFYKNRQLRESPSIKMQSIDKLHKYQDLVLENYYPQQSSEKSSLRSFMLSHQKSMGKLTIFQTRQQHQQRGLQKITSCQKSLHSFQKDKHYNCQIDNTIERDSERSMNMLGFGFPLLENQMTFRPAKDNEMRQEDIRWTQKRKQTKNYRHQQQIVGLTQAQYQVQIIRDNNIQVSSPQQRRYPKTKQNYPYIEPLVISGRKHTHSRQRSLSITEGYPSSTSFSVSKKLLYESDQVPESGSNGDKDRVEQKQRGEGSIVDNMEEGQFQCQQSKQVKMKNVKHHKSNNVSSLIHSQQYQQQYGQSNKNKTNKPASVHINSNFYLTRRKQAQIHRQSHFPPIIKKRLLPKTESKKEFYQSQPINISQLLYNNNNNKGLERNRDKDDDQIFNGDNNNKNNNNKDNDNSRVNSINISNNNFNTSFINNNNNNHHTINSNNNSRINIITPVLQQWDNRSQTNSVNRALIKKNIKAQREMDQLIQRLEKAQIKIDQQQQLINELSSKLLYYKQQLSKTSIQTIEYKSTIQSLQAESILMQNNLIQMENNLKDKDVQLQKRDIYIGQLIKQIEQLKEGVQKIELKYEQRLVKVKQYCKQYVEKKHQQQIDQIIKCYQEELNQLSLKIVKLQEESTRLKEQNICINGERNMLQKERDILKEQRDILKQQRDNLLQQQNSLRQQNDSQHKQIGELQQSLNQSQYSLNKQQEQRIKLQNQKINLQRQLTKHQQQTIKLQQQLQFINDKIREYQKHTKITQDISVQTDQCYSNINLFNKKKNKLYPNIFTVCILRLQQKVTLQEKQQLFLQSKLIDINLLLQLEKRKSKLQFNHQPYQPITIIQRNTQSNQFKQIKQSKQLKQLRQLKQLSISSSLIHISLLSQTKNATLSSSQQALIVQQSSFIKNNHHQSNHQDDYYKNHINKLTINSYLYSLTIINHQKQRQQPQQQIKSQSSLLHPIKQPTINQIDHKIQLKSPQTNNINHYYPTSSQQINIKSPSLQKKQLLLNTPSTQSYLQTFKHTTIRSSQHQQQQQQQRQNFLEEQNQSFHTVQFIINNNNNNYNKNNRKQQPIDPQSSSSLIQSYKHTQSKSFTKQIIQEQQMDSFFTCIEFSNSSLNEINKSHSFINNKNHHSSNIKIKSCQQHILPKEIFMVKNRTFTEDLSEKIQQSISEQKQKDLSCVQGESQQLQEKQHTQQQSIEINQFQKHKHHEQHQKDKQKKLPFQLFKVFNPSKINQFIQIQQPQITNRSRASSKHLKKPKQPYFKITLSKQKQQQAHQNQQQFYSKSFQKHLTPYFKKHTNFIFSHQLLNQEFVPDVQKMYVLNVSRGDQHYDSDKQNVQNQQNNNSTHRFLLYKRLIVNLQNDHKLELPKSSMLKFITDENRLALGNFQIIITSDQQLKVTRKNKRCFYMGELQDATWKIHSLQQVTPLVHSHKKQSKN